MNEDFIIIDARPCLTISGTITNCSALIWGKRFLAIISNSELKWWIIKEKKLSLSNYFSNNESRSVDSTGIIYNTNDSFKIRSRWQISHCFWTSSQFIVWFQTPFSIRIIYVSQVNRSSCEHWPHRVTVEKLAAKRNSFIRIRCHFSLLTSQSTVISHSSQSSRQLICFTVAENAEDCNGVCICVISDFAVHAGP